MARLSTDKRNCHRGESTLSKQCAFNPQQRFCIQFIRITEPDFGTGAASYSQNGDQRFWLAARAATRKGTGLDALSTNKDSMAIRLAPAIAIMAISSLPRFDFLRVVPTWGYATPICYMYANERRECAYPSLSAINASANCKPSWAIPCPVPFITCP